jgi:hypothetical protein
MRSVTDADYSDTRSCSRLLTGEGAVASDAGAGSGLGWPFNNIVDVVQDAVGDLVTELNSFTKFRDRIDQLLSDLKGSPADPKKLSEDPITPTQFGDPAWSEATVLFKSYQTVITELESLSKLLSDSIEGMSIAVLASHKGYENLDEDIRERMLAIKADAQDHYGGEYNPVPDRAKPGDREPAVAKPAGGDTTSSEGLSWGR